MSIIAGMFSPGVAVTINLDTTLPQPVEYVGKSTAVIPASTIWWIKSSTGGCIIRIEDATGPGGGKTVIHSTDTAADIAAAAGCMFTVTQSGALTSEEYPTGAFYVNNSLFQGVEAYSTGSFLMLGTKSANVRLYVAQNPATIIAALATSIPDDRLPVVAVTATTAPAAAGAITTSASDAIVNITSASLSDRVQLPTAVVGNVLRLFVGANGCVVLPAGGQLIDTGGSTQLAEYGSIMLVCTSTNNWTSQVTQVGGQANFKTQTIDPIDPAAGLTLGNSGGGVNVADTGAGDVKLQANTGDAIVESASGDTRLDATAGNAIITADVAITATSNTGNITLTSTTGNVELQGGYTYIGSLIGLDSGASVTGSAVPGTISTTALVYVDTNALNNGIQFPSSNGASHYVVYNDSANPCFVWDEASTPIRATAIAVGDVAVFWKFGATWVSYDFTPVA